MDKGEGWIQVSQKSLKCHNNLGAENSAATKVLTNDVFGPDHEPDAIEEKRHFSEVIYVYISLGCYMFGD